MRLVVFKGVQYDADKLPPHVDAGQAVPLKEWFALNRKPQRPRVGPEPEKPKKRRTRRASRDD